ncbi:D-inositol 3-phosphate glycosyltransferase [subsurface metagenome]
MNILYCDPLRTGELRGLFAHIYEVSSNLTKLGHNVVFPKVIHPHKQSLPLWARIEGLSPRLPIIGTVISEIYTFFLILSRIVKHRERFDVIYRRHNAINSECLLSKLFGIPLVKEVNGFEVDLQEDGDSSSLRARILGRIERFTMSKADRFIVVTSKLKKALHRDYGIPEDKIVVIGNGANVDLFQPMDVVKARAELNLSQSDYYVCLVGSNLLPYQGTGRIIRAAPFLLERFPHTRFLIVGGTVDSVKRELIDTVDKAGLGDKFIFTGLVPYQQVPLYINASDVCIVLQKGFLRKSGSSPLKLCEYMACEKPVVASRTYGSEFLEVNNSGLLVNSESPEEIAGAIARLLESKELRTDMGKNGRRYVVENRSWQIVAKRTAQVCQDAVEEHQKRAQEKARK